MKPRHPKAISSFLRSQSELKRLTDHSQRFSDLLDSVRKLLPDSLSEHCLAAVVRDKTLILYTESSAWASRLRFISRQLIGELTKSGMNVTKISVRVQLPAKSQRRRQAKIIRKLSNDNASLIRQLADHLDDKELSDSLRRLSRHSKSNLK